jgi:hypothetical protein
MTIGRADSPLNGLCAFPGPMGQAGMVRAVGAGAERLTQLGLVVQWGEHGYPVRGFSETNISLAFFNRQIWRIKVWGQV